MIDIKDNMESVAKLLNIEIGEQFKIKYNNNKKPYEKGNYFLTKDRGLVFRNNLSGGEIVSNSLQGLLLGKHKISRISD